MSESKLKITSVEKAQPATSPNKISTAARRQEIQAAMDRLWKEDPEQFNPQRDSVQRRRIAATLETLRDSIDLKGKLVADIGCGGGDLSRSMRDSGAKIHAIDASSLALGVLKAHNTDNITANQDCLPTTLLPDNAYDVVVCTEVIGYLKPQEYRMAFSELARIIKTEGVVVCSTPIDIDSENALERFAALAETEFEIDKWILNYDVLWIRLLNFLSAPESYAKASRDPSLRTHELSKRGKLGRGWFNINSSPALGFVWHLVSFVTRPIANLFAQNNSLMVLLEKISRFFWSETGISHALFIGKKRKMVFPLPANEIPREMKHKRQVWE